MPDAPSSIFSPIKFGAHIVPGIWRYMLPEEVLYFRVDPERQSTCFDCPQVKAFGFHPGIRCCAFIPRVPNFLLGLALMDEATAPIVSRYIQSGFTLPEGSQLAPEQLFASLAHVSPQHKTAASVVCPFLDTSSKKCQIYAYRNGVCSSFFCRHDRGEASAHFWEHLRDLVSQIEAALSQWALGEMGFDLEAYFKLFDGLSSTYQNCSAPESGAWSEAVRAQLFGSWFGREEELFRSTADLVIAHKDELYAIACRQRLLQPKGFDAQSRSELLHDFARHLVDETVPEGEPESIASIWYATQLAQRNLQLTAFAKGPHS